MSVRVRDHRDLIDPLGFGGVFYKADAATGIYSVYAWLGGDAYTNVRNFTDGKEAVDYALRISGRSPQPEV